MKILVPLKNHKDNSDEKNLFEDHQYTHYFKDRTHEIAFLLKINNPKFDSEIGIKQIHKEIPNEAKKLKKVFLKKFHPDKNEKDEDLDFNEICQDIDRTFFRVSGGKVK
jgi:hypothetical protein